MITKQKRECLFIYSNSDRTRENVFRLQEGKFRLDVRKKYFSQRLVRHSHSLPSEAVETPSLETCKARLNGALVSLT